jgi:hypothetical protein
VLLAEKVMSVGFLTTANVLLSFEVQWIHRTISEIVLRMNSRPWLLGQAVLLFSIHHDLI